MDGSKMIDVKGISKRFGKTEAVKDVSFSVNLEEVYSILGPSGCGKTTVLRSIAGLEDIDTGEIVLNGKIVSSRAKNISVPSEHRELGLVFQSYALWPHMSVFDNVAYGVRARKLPDVDRRVTQALDLVDLEGFEKRYPAQLSGGEQQRVALARSMAYEPKILLLDEPLSNLDEKVRQRMRVDLRRLLKKTGMTALYVTHDQEEAFVISDRILIMRGGSIIQEGSSREIYENPKSEFIATFIGGGNLLRAHVLECGKETARLRVDDFGAELVCKAVKGLEKGKEKQAIVRQNEIGLFSNPPPHQVNILQGKLISKEYKGDVTTYQVKTGQSSVTVTTHRFSRRTFRND